MYWYFNEQRQLIGSSTTSPWEPQEPWFQDVLANSAFIVECEPVYGWARDDEGSGDWEGVLFPSVTP